MPTNKTQFTDANVLVFINKLEQPKKIEDALKLIELMEKISGEKAKLFGTSIISFGAYHYKYASGHEGTAPLLGFSPRKSAISFYVFSNTPKQNQLLASLGKYTMGKACIYVKKLEDINCDVLAELMQENISFLTTTYTRL